MIHPITSFLYIDNCAHKQGGMRMRITSKAARASKGGAHMYIASNILTLLDLRDWRRARADCWVGVQRSCLVVMVAQLR